MLGKSERDVMHIDPIAQRQGVTRLIRHPLLRWLAVALVSLLLVGLISETPGWVFRRSRVVTVINDSDAVVHVAYAQNQENTFHTTIWNDRDIDPGASTRFSFRRNDALVASHDPQARDRTSLALEPSMRVVRITRDPVTNDHVFTVERQ